MRRLFACLFLLHAGFAVPAGAQAITHVRNIGTGTVGSGSGFTIPVTVAAPAGNTVFVATACFPQATATVTDSRGNTYVNNNVGFVNNGLTTNIHRGFITTALQPGDQISVDFGTTVGAGGSAHEFTGVANAAVDVSGATAAPGGSFATNSVTTTQANELLFAYTYHDPGTSVTPTGGFTALTDANGNLFTAYRIVSSIASYNYTGTIAPPSTGFLTAQFGAYKGVILPVELQEFEVH